MLNLILSLTLYRKVEQDDYVDDFSRPIKILSAFFLSCRVEPSGVLGPPAVLFANFDGGLGSRIIWWTVRFIQRSSY